MFTHTYVSIFTGTMLCKVSILSQVVIASHFMTNVDIALLGNSIIAQNVNNDKSLCRCSAQIITNSFFNFLKKIMPCILLRFHLMAQRKCVTVCVCHSFYAYYRH